jgi:hypothetical protein
MYQEGVPLESLLVVEWGFGSEVEVFSAASLAHLFTAS